MNKAQLEKFCKEHGIVVPKGATTEYLNAAIVRASLHKKRVKGGSCFGFWAFEESACIVCDFEKNCFKASIGMEKDKYFKSLESLENPKIRFSKKKLTK